jgi:redox-sensitive bicupin YhaK (pirin superfamily)
MRRAVAASAALVVGLLAGGAGLTVSAASEAPVPAIQLTELSRRGEFIDDVSMQLRVKLDGRRTQVLNVGDPSRMVVARITLQPGAQFPWHTHPGPVLVTVVHGALTYVNANDCVERYYGQGTAFVDPGGGNVHTAFNSHAGVTELYAVFLDAPPEGGLSITQGITPGSCNIVVGAHGSH